MQDFEICINFHFEVQIKQRIIKYFNDALHAEVKMQNLIKHQVIRMLKSAIHAISLLTI